MNLLGYYNYTIILTNLSLLSSVFGIYSAMEGYITTAVLCLMVSGLCDMFDGKVARTKVRCREEKSFGIQLDSLSDLVCFGILPTVIGYAMGMYSWISILIFALYVTAALIRLAYFNVKEEERQSLTEEKREFYTGLPVTAAALLVPLIYIMGKFISLSFHRLYGFSLLVIAFAFVLDFPVKKPGKAGSVILILIGAAEFICMLTGIHYAG